MNSMSEEADPSDRSAAVRNAAAGAVTGRVTFNRFELNRILNLYGRMVADGRVARLCHRFPAGPRRILGVPPRVRSADLPHRKRSAGAFMARKQGMYSVISATGLILRRGHELDRVLLVIDRKLAAV